MSVVQRSYNYLVYEELMYVNLVLNFAIKKYKSVKNLNKIHNFLQKRAGKLRKKLETNYAINF